MTEPRIEVVAEARDLRQALKMASTLQPNIVLIDLHMPGQREFEPATVKSQLLASSERVIAMSVSNDDGAKALAKEYGAVTLLDKFNLSLELIPALLQTSR
jgi:CheY-like chemotaxis protein